MIWDICMAEQKDQDIVVEFLNMAMDGEWEGAERLMKQYVAELLKK